LPIQSLFFKGISKHFNIAYILFKCNDLSKELSLIFKILESVFKNIRLLKNIKINNFILIPLFSACVHGLVGACISCAEAAKAHAATLAAQHAAIGACTHK